MSRVLYSALGDGALLCKIIEQRHHCCDRRVVLQILKITANLLDRLMHLCLKIRRVSLLVGHDILQFPDTLQESAASLYAIFRPGSAQIKRTDEHLIGTQRICTVLSYNIVRVYYVSSGLTDIFSPFSPRIMPWEVRFWYGSGARNNPLIIEELMPESGIEQMQCRVLHTAVVPVNRHPVFQRLCACECLVVVRIGITQEIPGRSRPLWHGICLTLCRTAAARAGGVHPVRHCS